MAERNHPNGSAYTVNPVYPRFHRFWKPKNNNIETTIHHCCIKMKIKTVILFSCFAFRFYVRSLFHISDMSSTQPPFYISLIRVSGAINLHTQVLCHNSCQSQLAYYVIGSLCFTGFCGTLSSLDPNWTAGQHFLFRPTQLGAVSLAPKYALRTTNTYFPKYGIMFAACCGPSDGC